MATAQGIGTLDVSASTIASLYPGADGNLLLRVHNPNQFPVKVTEVAQGSDPITSNQVGCDVSTLSVSDANLSNEVNQSHPIVVGANRDSAKLTLHDVVSMSEDAENACQGAAFTIPVTLTAESTPQG